MTDHRIGALLRLRHAEWGTLGPEGILRGGEPLCGPQMAARLLAEQLVERITVPRGRWTHVRVSPAGHDFLAASAPRATVTP